MKKYLIVFLVLICALPLFCSYNVGEIVSNYPWTDNTGTAHNIYELVDQGVALVLFWGGTS